MFALLTDPEKILRWMGTEAQVEPRPGGLYLSNVTGARFARGSFREVVPVHRLAYSFGWDGSEEVPPGSSLIEIDLVEQPDGTLLRLTHSGLPNAEQCAGHAEGWAITSAGWPRLQPGATRARIPGTAAPAVTDCFPHPISPRLTLNTKQGGSRRQTMFNASPAKNRGSFLAQRVS